MKRFYFNAFFILFCFSVLITCIEISTSHAALRTVTGTVTKVSDGDTIHITTPEQTKLRVRLYGVDAPETPKISHQTGQINIPGQPYGIESWRALEGKIMDGKGIIGKQGLLEKIICSEQDLT